MSLLVVLLLQKVSLVQDYTALSSHQALMVESWWEMWRTCFQERSTLNRRLAILEAILLCLAFLQSIDSENSFSLSPSACSLVSDRDVGQLPHKGWVLPVRLFRLEGRLVPLAAQPKKEELRYSWEVLYYITVPAGEQWYNCNTLCERMTSYAHVIILFAQIEHTQLL